MSYQEKRIISSSITGILIFAAYCIYALGKYHSGTEDLKYWAGLILIFEGLSVAITIIIQIVFHIVFAVSIAVKEQIKNGNCDDTVVEQTMENEMVTDERDKLIQLKSLRTGFYVAGFGFVLGLFSLVLNYSPVIMLNIIYLSFFLGSMFDEFAQLYYYRRGV